MAGLKEASNHRMNPVTTNSIHRYELAMEIGEEAVRQGQWQQAMTCFQTALSGLPREPRVYNGLGNTYMALADNTRALSCFKEAARLAPDIPDYSDKVAELQYQLDMPSEAARTYLMAGDIYWKRGRPEDARERWERSASILPDLIGPHERLAMYHLRREEPGGAIRHYLIITDLLRQDGRCLMALHTCYMALALDPDNRLVWTATEQAWACVAAREREKNADPAQVEIGGLINAAAEFAQWQLSTEYRQNTLRGVDGEQALRDDLLREAMLHEGHNRVGPAITFYERAIAAGLDSPAAFFALGFLYRLVGRLPDAQAALTLAGRHPFYARAAELIDS